MPPLIITPGTFNPPATPVENAGIYLFAKQPDVTLTRRPQQSSRSRVAGFPPLPSLGIPVKYTLVDFLTGAITVGVDVPALDLSKPNFTATGATYVTNGLYVKTASNSGAKTYSAVGTPIFTVSGGTGIDLGTVEIGGSGGGALAFNNFLVRLDYNIILVGGSLPFESVIITPSTTPTELTGVLETGVLIPGSPHLDGWGDRAFDQTGIITATLRSSSAPVDKVYLLVRFTGSIHFTTAAATRPTIVSGLTITERLYRDAPGVITPPTIPYAAYLRESFGRRGTLTLS